MKTGNLSNAFQKMATKNNQDNESNPIIMISTPQIAKQRVKNNMLFTQK